MHSWTSVANAYLQHKSVQTIVRLCSKVFSGARHGKMDVFAKASKSFTKVGGDGAVGLGAATQSRKNFSLWKNSSNENTITKGHENPIGDNEQHFPCLVLLCTFGHIGPTLSNFDTLKQEFVNSDRSISKPEKVMGKHRIYLISCQTLAWFDLHLRNPNSMDFEKDNYVNGTEGSICLCLSFSEVILINNHNIHSVSKPLIIYHTAP